MKATAARNRLAGLLLGACDIFGAGKVLVLARSLDKDGQPYAADLRAVLKAFAKTQFEKSGYTLNAANEIEGFLFKGADAERTIMKPASLNTSAPADITTPSQRYLAPFH